MVSGYGRIGSRGVLGLGAGLAMALAAGGFLDTPIARAPREERDYEYTPCKRGRRLKKMRPVKPYVSRVNTSGPDERADKYLHSAARRRRAEERAALDVPAPLSLVGGL